MAFPRHPRLLAALAIGFVFHGALLYAGTYQRTYDAYIHIFFADHYVRAWFDHWEYRWYTGFPMTSYPPGSHQAIALLAPLIGLLNGYVVVQLAAILLVIVGVYRFSRLWVDDEAAANAALLAVWASSIALTVHVFGQLPTIFSLGFLLNALPYLDRWLRRGELRWLLAAWALNAATTAGHHVTTLFGAVFFAGPVIAAAVVERWKEPLPDEGAAVPFGGAWLVRRIRRTLPALLRVGVYGGGLIVILLGVVLPYWLWSRADPIIQVSIPHASRDSFIANLNAGLVFWLIPYGVALVALPYIVRKGVTTRAWPLFLSFALLFVLGTGGTTPIPRLLLGGAYDILTLDRFTFWATILLLPLLGQFVSSLHRGGLATYLRSHWSAWTWRGVQIGLAVAYLAVAIFTVNLTQFRRFQPPSIDMQPIVQFLQKDEHWRWRYLALGFGDQIAWLSAQTTVTTVDGDYHSARRLPELTSTPVERLEGAKYRGMPGIGSLQQILAVPEKYNLKYVFSNDLFYDPLLFFSGWHRVQRLENGVMVWEREDIPPLPPVLPRREIPAYQRVLWGVVPMTAIASALLTLTISAWPAPFRRLRRVRGIAALQRGLRRAFPIRRAYAAVDRRLRRWAAPAPRAPQDCGDRSALRRVVAGRRARRIACRRRPPRKTRSPRVRVLPSLPSLRLRLLRHALLLLLLLVTAGIVAQARAARSPAAIARDPLAVVRAYYNDLDYRRPDRAYAWLDPQTRPSYEQYTLQRSVAGGLVASYGMLESIQPRIVSATAGEVVVEADVRWMTAVATYPMTERWTLVQRDRRWYIVPPPPVERDVPDQLVRRSVIEWMTPQRDPQADDSYTLKESLDRPELQVISARLVKLNDRYSIVGEVLNTDVDPADVTVTGTLYGADGQPLTWYNASTAMLHKLLPKESTPFRIDFEGVAGATLSDAAATAFDPDAFSPPGLAQPIASFGVAAKAVVTSYDLDRDLSQQLALRSTDGGAAWSGTLINGGTVEATVPHVLVAYYDRQDRVAWVDQQFVPTAIQPQQAQYVSIPITPAAAITPIDVPQRQSSEPLRRPPVAAPADNMIALPPALGYASARISVNYFTGGAW